MVSESSGYWIALSEGEADMLYRELMKLTKEHYEDGTISSFPVARELTYQLRGYQDAKANNS